VWYFSRIRRPRVFFVGGVDIFISRSLNARVFEHSNAISETESGSTTFRDLKVSGIGIFALNHFHPVITAFAETFEDEEEETFGEVDDFFPVVVDFHFKIETGEFCKMTRCIAILRPENRPYLKNLLHISSNSHLLIKLGTLRQESRGVEVIDLKDSTTTFRSSSGDLRSLKLLEMMLYHMFPEEFTDSPINLKDSLVGRRP